MAGKTPTELIRELQLEIAKLIVQINGLKDEVRTAGLTDLREKLAKFEERLSSVDWINFVTQLATLQEQVSELKKWRDERDRRQWQFWLGVGICGLTFTANLVVNLLIFFARKPG